MQKNYMTVLDRASVDLAQKGYGGGCLSHPPLIILRQKASPGALNVNSVKWTYSHLLSGLSAFIFALTLVGKSFKV